MGYPLSFLCSPPHMVTSDLTMSVSCELWEPYEGEKGRLWHHCLGLIHIRSLLNKRSLYIFEAMTSWTTDI